MSKLTTKLGVMAIGGGLAALVMAGAPALASTHHAASAVTGPEVFSGSLQGQAALVNNPIVHVHGSGLITTYGTVSLGSSTSTTHTVKTAAGDLVVQGASKGTTSQSANPKTCAESFTNEVTFTVEGSKSTGKFAGTSGDGAAQVHFGAVAPRFTSGPKKGQCNFNGQPGAKGASATFLASIVLTTG